MFLETYGSLSPGRSQTRRRYRPYLSSQDSGLLACATDDLFVRVYDTDTRQLVRQFGPHSGVITDLAWSPDARWLVVPSADTTVRVWDLPAGQLVDVFRSAKPVTSCAFSPSGDFLVTTHADSRAVFLWSNRAYFGAIFLRPLRVEEEMGAEVEIRPPPQDTTTTQTTHRKKCLSSQPAQRARRKRRSLT